MEAMEDQVHAVSLVLAVEFWIAVVVTDEHAATDTCEVPHAQMLARRVVREISGAAVGITGAEPLVIPIDDLTGTADDIDAVVRLGAPGQPMRRAEDHPHTELAGQRDHAVGG